MKNKSLNRRTISIDLDTMQFINRPHKMWGYNFGKIIRSWAYCKTLLEWRKKNVCVKLSVKFLLFGLINILYCRIKKNVLFDVILKNWKKNRVINKPCAVGSVWSNIIIWKEKRISFHSGWGKTNRKSFVGWTFFLYQIWLRSVFFCCVYWFDVWVPIWNFNSKEIFPFDNIKVFVTKAFTYQLDYGFAHSLISYNDYANFNCTSNCVTISSIVANCFPYYTHTQYTQFIFTIFSLRNIKFVDVCNLFRLKMFFFIVI